MADGNGQGDSGVSTLINVQVAAAYRCCSHFDEHRVFIQNGHLALDELDLAWRAHHCHRIGFIHIEPLDSGSGYR